MWARRLSPNDLWTWPPASPQSSGPRRFSRHFDVIPSLRLSSFEAGFTPRLAQPTNPIADRNPVALLGGHTAQPPRPSISSVPALVHITLRGSVASRKSNLLRRQRLDPEDFPVASRVPLIVAFLRAPQSPPPFRPCQPARGVRRTHYAEGRGPSSAGFLARSATDSPWLAPGVRRARRARARSEPGKLTVRASRSTCMNCASSMP